MLIDLADGYKAENYNIKDINLNIPKRNYDNGPKKKRRFFLKTLLFLICFPLFLVVQILDKNK